MLLLNCTSLYTEKKNELLAVVTWCRCGILVSCVGLLKMLLIKSVELYCSPTKYNTMTIAAKQINCLDSVKYVCVNLVTLNCKEQTNARVRLSCSIRS